MEKNEDGSGERAKIPVYFQTLSEEILRRILRFLVILDGNIDVKGELILAQSHPLHSTTKSVFKRLDIMGDVTFAVECLLSEAFDENPIDYVSLGRNTSNEELDTILEATKNSIKSVEFSTMHHMSQDLRRICKLIASHGKNIRKLRIFDYQEMKVDEELDEALGTIVCALAPQLTSLSCEFIYQYVTPSILATSLYRKVTSLKELSLLGDYSDMDVFEVLAKNCSETIEELKMMFNDATEKDWKKTIDDIRKYCPKLTVLYLKEPTLAGVSERDYVSLLTSYGHQLVSIAPLKFSPDALQCLREACPNLRLRVELGEDELDWNCLSGASDIVSYAKMELYFHHNFRRLSNLLRHCHNLVEMEIRYVSDEQVFGLNSVICSPLYQLEKLDLRGLTFQACVNIVEKCSSRLRQLSLSTREPITDAELFPRLVATATNLQLVFIDDGADPQSPMAQSAGTKSETVYIEIVRPFLKCKYLKNLCLMLNIPVSADKLRAICLPFRTRDVSCLFTSQGIMQLRIDDQTFIGKSIYDLSDSDSSSSDSLSSNSLSSDFSDW